MTTCNMTEPVLLQRVRTENDPGKLTVAAEFLSDARGPLRPELLDQILAELARSFVDPSLGTDCLVGKAGT